MLVAVLGVVFFGLLEASSSYSSRSSDTRHHAMAKKATGCSKKSHSRPCQMPPRRKQCRLPVEPSCSQSNSMSRSSNSCSESESCSKTDSCSMSVSWEESQVHAEIVRQRVKNPKHRLYCRPACPSSSSSTSSCKSVSCPTEYTTIELIRPHVARHHKRHIRVKEEICPLSTEVEIIRKKKKHCRPCEKKCHKKKVRYEVVCKPSKRCKPCEKKPCKPCKKTCEKKPCEKKCHNRRR